MSVSNKNKQLTPEVFKQYEFYENELKSKWYKPIVNENLSHTIYLYITENNGRYKATGWLGPKLGIFKLKEKYIENTIDLAILICNIREINFSTFLDYFEYCVI